MSPRPKLLSRGLLCLVASALAWTAYSLAGLAPPRTRPTSPPDARIQTVAWQPDIADPLDGGVAWINTGGPITLKELRGKIVLLDFWTYCCINCHHVLPDLARLEEKYKNEIVVIGVHSPKFLAERDIKNVREKVREYGIKHPVVCDSDQVIWNRFGVNSWPTLGVIDPDGNVVTGFSGEGHYAELDRVIGGLVEKFRAKGVLKETPVKFFPENEKPDESPLLFPGKVLADAEGKRLFVSDTGHNRIIISDLSGKNPVAIGNGSVGLVDGSYARAEFHRPQGMTLVGQTLYVADTENHAIRAVDLKAKTVATIAGTGVQAHNIARPGTIEPARKSALNSPWDLAHVDGHKALYVAMAGPHQIWKLDLEASQIGPWAGNGRENIVDGPIAVANFAQPSGLATDGRHLFVADSEVSALRSITLNQARNVVQTIVGEGLFEFGDVDGRGPSVRLQHCLGVSFSDGKLYVADTYNNKVKVCDPTARTVKSLAGDGETKDFYQPGGVSASGQKLYVADTNNHRIRLVDLAAEGSKIQTLDLDGLTPPAPKPRKPTFVNAQKLDAQKAEVGPGKELTLNVNIPVPAGYKLNTDGKMPVLVEAPETPGLIDADQLPETGVRVDSKKTFNQKITLARPVVSGEAFKLKLSVSAFVCNEGSNLCTIKSYIWNIPVVVAAKGNSQVEVKAAE